MPQVRTYHFKAGAEGSKAWALGIKVPINGSKVGAGASEAGSYGVKVPICQ